MKTPIRINSPKLAYSNWLIERVCISGALLFSIAVVIYCIWTLDRGFEITDEAYYLLAAIHAGTQEVYISAQHWITGWLWKSTESLVMFRAAGMIALLLTSALLALGVFSVSLRNGVLENNVKSRSGMIAGSIVCAMLYASTINFSPSYNLIATAGAYAAAGLVLLGSQRPSFAYKFMLYFFAGCGIGAEVISKASAGASTYAILIVWLCVFEITRFNKIFGLLVMTAGVIVFCGIVLFANTTISDASYAIENGLEIFRIVQSEAIDARLTRYLVQFSQYIKETLFFFAIPIISFALYAKKQKILFVIFGLVVLIIILINGRYLFGGWNYDGSLTPPYAIVGLIIMILIISFAAWRNNKNQVVLIVGLILLPYSVAMGTGNTLFTQIIISLAPWGALVGALMFARSPENTSKMPILIIGLCFIGTVSSQIITSGFRPYQISNSLIDQNQTFVMENLKRVKVDAETHKFLEGIRAAAKKCDLAPGFPFLGFYNIPGVALALQASPVITPWLNNVEQADFVLNRTDQKRLRSVLVALKMENNGAQMPPLPEQLKDFPLSYIYCGTVTYPFHNQIIQIWRHSNQ
jgi:hypothetical protein